MKQVKYTGHADKRTLKAADFRRNGVEDQNMVEWSRENGFVAEVTEDAADWLVTLDGFQVVNDDIPDDNEDDEDE
jgi:hypothetical protein